MKKISIPLTYLLCLVMALLFQGSKTSANSTKSKTSKFLKQTVIRTGDKKTIEAHKRKQIDRLRTLLSSNGVPFDPDILYLPEKEAGEKIRMFKSQMPEMQLTRFLSPPLKGVNIADVLYLRETTPIVEDSVIIVNHLRLAGKEPVIRGNHNLFIITRNIEFVDEANNPAEAGRLTIDLSGGITEMAGSEKSRIGFTPLKDHPDRFRNPNAKYRYSAFIPGLPPLLSSNSRLGSGSITNQAFGSITLDDVDGEDGAHATCDDLAGSGANGTGPDKAAKGGKGDRGSVGSDGGTLHIWIEHMEQRKNCPENMVLYARGGNGGTGGRGNDGGTGNRGGNGGRGGDGAFCSAVHPGPINFDVIDGGSGGNGGPGGAGGDGGDGGTGGDGGPGGNIHVSLPCYCAPDSVGDYDVSGGTPGFGGSPGSPGAGGSGGTIGNGGEPGQYYVYYWDAFVYGRRGANGTRNGDNGIMGLPGYFGDPGNSGRSGTLYAQQRPCGQ